MKQLTIRNVSPRLAKRLAQERAATGKSLNQLVLDLLERSLGLVTGSRYDNGLAALAGTWSNEEHAAFEKSTAVFEQIDEELW